MSIDGRSVKTEEDCRLNGCFVHPDCICGNAEDIELINNMLSLN